MRTLKRNMEESVSPLDLFLFVQYSKYCIFICLSESAGINIYTFNKIYSGAATHDWEISLYTDRSLFQFLY